MKAEVGMTVSRTFSVVLLVLSATISILWGSFIGLTHHSITDFRAVYYGTRCLLEHHNPYRVGELEQVLSTERGERPSESLQQHEAMTLYVNLPSTFIFVAPFALLPYTFAQVLWLSLLATLLLLAGFATWNLSERFAPRVSLFLTCLVLANSLTIFTGGNTAGIAVPLCLISAWCFLQDRFVPIGVFCMGISLAIKPHDPGLVWLYFLLLGGIYRKRALQSLMVTLALIFAGSIWVWLVAPHWVHDWSSNMRAISTPGHINDPSPASVVGFHTLGPVIDLRSVTSVFLNQPLLYNLISYLICGALLLVWAIMSLKSRFSKNSALLALAAVVPLTMLIAYHRPWDAKLLLLTIPGCAILWGRTGASRWVALLITSATLLSASDIPMAFSIIVAEHIHLALTGLRAQIATALLARPIPLTLLIASVFYLWIYVRHSSRYAPDSHDRSNRELADRLDEVPYEFRSQQPSRAGVPVTGEQR